MKPYHLIAAAALAALLIGTLGGANAQQAGVTSAVNPTVQGTPPGGQARVLNLGANVTRNERIVTSDQGLTQILFNDGTNLSVGPNADVTIDEYVYNPNQGTGRMAVTLARGVLQLTGGRIANSSEVTITGPIGTIGIRGAVGIASVTPGGAQTGAMVYGKAMTVTGQTGAPQTVNQSNFVIIIPGPGQPAGAPTFLTPGMLGQLGAALKPPPGSSGGASSPPTEGSVQASGGGLTQIVTSPLSVGGSFVQPTGSLNQAFLNAIGQSVAQATGTKDAYAQALTSPLIAGALLSQLVGLVGSDTLSVLFNRVRGVDTSTTGTVNGQSVTISTANGQNFSSLISGQSGNVNVRFGSGSGAVTIPLTISTSAPTLRQMDDIPSSTQRLTGTLFGIPLDLGITNSLKSIRGTNIASGTINGIAFRFELPANSKFGSTPSTTPVRLFLNGQLIGTGNLAKLNLGFKP